MEEKRLLRWKLPSLKLNEPTKLCKICFKEYRDSGLYYLFHDSSICLHCLRELEPQFTSFKVDNYKAISIYNYSDRVKSLLYQFKGCFDIEIYDVFLERFARELQLKFLGYVMVPIPSYKDDDEKREFNHVVEMFKVIKLPMIKALVKTSNVKQANSPLHERQNISKHLELINGVNLTGKKVLLVDDVYTTGSTMKAAITLIEKLHPKTIKVLVMSKAINKNEEVE